MIAPPLRLEVGRPNDVVFSAIVRKLGAHEPFRTYALGLMVPIVMDQLAYGANVIGVRAGELVAYAGWLRVRRDAAEAWYAREADMPAADWTGDAAISTIIVADDPADLRPLVRKVSSACAGLPVFRMRTFPGDRADHKRPPITGRPQISPDGA